MNFIQQPKILKLIQKNQEVDLLVASSAISGDDLSVRKNIDERRKLRALLEREGKAASKSESSTINDYHQSNSEIAEFISLWSKRGQKIKHSPEFLLNNDYCDLIIDAYIPDTWDWDNDLVIIVHSVSDNLAEALALRGQKHIVLYSDPKIKCDLEKPLFKEAIVLEAQNLRELKAKIAQIRSRARVITKIYCDPDHEQIAQAREDVEEAIRAGRNDAQINVNTQAFRGKAWATNILKNMPKMAETYNFCNMKVHGTSHAVIVAPGPSLEKNIDQLRKIQHRVFILAPLRSLPLLNRNGITPDLVVQVDALTEDDAKFFSKNKPQNVKNIFVEGYVNPLFFDLPAEKIIWCLHYEFDQLHALFNSEANKNIGPSVAIYCTQICLTLGIKNICLIGQDLAISDEKMYASGATDNLKSICEKDQFVHSVEGFWGGHVKTRSDYKFYIEQFSQLASDINASGQDVKFFNATEGGAFIDGFSHVKLIDYIKAQGLNTNNATKFIEFGAPNDPNSLAVEDFRRSFIRSMEKVIKLSKKIVEIDSNPNTNKSGTKKLNKLISEVRPVINEYPFLELAMQSEITDAVGNAAFTKSIPSYSEFFTNTAKHAKELIEAARYRS
ncbi:DUF115 domain-containing protein [Alphaproteobacteria bacterium]|nr:DUF115 domain-containing protein [Alphaproteobacteria bacterium]